MKRLELKAAARAELREIYEFSVGKFGIKVAEAYLAGLRALFDRIVDYPAAGRVYPGVTPEMRVMVFRQHRVFYQVAGDLILIVRVLHSRRDARGLLGGYWVD